MKLIIAVIQDKDVSKLTEKLVKEKIASTKLATTGGFLKAGNTTFMIGIEEEKVEHVLKCIEEACKKREELIPYTIGIPETNFTPITVGGAVVFVLDVEKFRQF